MPIALSAAAMIAAAGEIGAAGAAFGPAGLAIAAITIAGCIAYEAGFFDWLGDVLEDGWNWLKNGFGKVVQKAKSVVQEDIIPGVLDGIDWICKAVGIKGKGQVASTLEGIAEKYGDFKCKEAADAMSSHLKKKKEKGKIINIQYPSKPGYVLSISKGDKVISENGFHTGVEYKGLVYCNIHPYGLPKDKWKADFIGVGVPIYTEIPF